MLGMSFLIEGAQNKIKQVEELECITLQYSTDLPFAPVSYPTQRVHLGSISCERSLCFRLLSFIRNHSRSHAALVE